MANPKVASFPAPGARARSGEFDDQAAIDRSLTAEIVIALCGPMGTPLHEVAKTFKELLEGTDYGYDEVVILTLSDEIRERSNLREEKSIVNLIEAGNSLRERYGNAVLARLAIKKITLSRERVQIANEVYQKGLFDSDVPDADILLPRATRRCCHVIDSIKHVDELRLLRSVYGDMLQVVGVYSPIELRIERLERRKGPGDEIHKLIDRDSGEEVSHGQRVEDTFPQSDFFLRVDSTTDTHRQARVRRFLDLLLGAKIVTPTVNERAMYAAFSAARNSACLSRQVGAAITSGDGEVISTGWNDVPRAFGGLYGTADQNSSPDKDRRCWNMDGGKCFNDEEKTLIANALVDKLLAKELIDPELRERVFNLVRHDSQLKSLIEFSRAVHAEMHALQIGRAHV